MSKRVLLAYGRGFLLVLALAVILMGTGCDSSDGEDTFESPRLVGGVRDCNGEPMAGVRVSLIFNREGDLPGCSFTFYSKGQTDEDGVYSISLENVPPGDYEVLVYQDGRPYTVQPITLEFPIIGVTKGPSFVIGNGL